MAETMDVFAELKQQPAYVIGQVDADDSVQEIHDAGAQMQRAFAQANESYETLMTAPRSDMGDSIKKHFPMWTIFYRICSWIQVKQTAVQCGYWHITIPKLHRKILWK